MTEHQVLTYETDWLGQPALVLETQSLRFVTVPRMGAKIVSLLDRCSGREWLLPPVNRAFAPARYGASFEDQDMSGWDEMFPTIDACLYPVEGRDLGQALPDHGEVWAVPWQIDSMTNDAIRLSVNGRALPYQLTRETQALDDRRIRLGFEVINTGSEPLAALWAAHPQFAVDDQTRIRLPSSVVRIVNVHPTDDWGTVGEIDPWPEAQSRVDNRLHRLDAVGSAELHNCRKFYVPPDQSVSWAALQQDSDGDWIRLSWEASHVPYLGIWVDEGTYNAAPTIALEPATGYYDDLGLAWRNNRAMHLLPNEPVRWHLDIEAGQGSLAAPNP